jgi:hypothetical protein
MLHAPRELPHTYPLRVLALHATGHATAYRPDRLLLNQASWTASYPSIPHQIALGNTAPTASKHCLPIFQQQAPERGEQVREKRLLQAALYLGHHHRSTV